MMQKEFLKEFQKKEYFKNHQRVLLAVSGGLDSMTLLHLLYQYQRELDIELVIAHVNHRQRPESDDEEKELSEIAQKLGVKIFTSSFSGMFSEARGRQFRYQFFAEVMKAQGCTALVTAHHADDQAETIFMRLLRGSRLRHLTGIQEVQDFAGGQLIRPLLHVHKKDFPPVHHFQDSSNLQNDYLRNRIRNLYLPALEKENPQFLQALLDMGQEVGHLQAALAYFTKEMDITDMAVFHQQIFPVQVFLLQDYLAQFPDLTLSKQQFEEVLQILRTKANYLHPLKTGYELVKDYSHFQIRKISRKPDLKKDSILLECDNLIQFGDYRFSFGLPLQGADTEQVSVAAHAPVTLRYRQSGDVLLLNGCHKKVRRLFIERKLSLEERESAVIVEQNQQILAIPNIAVSDLSKGLKNDIMGTVLYIQKLDR
ncbi:tRNA lysidine(34) synthetase TilS [Streptococcus panodentis]|uniref:tRNA(Ile)-lysidine synthase n=1 Tax=Streptococcus panodentis TaxID=1581472 RepID=A0ABS5AUG4_9STRE|nr:tRNA lysidine(34) synthetase TilS [Streptococcus panodentis]MBP2620218.1 tRNA lysidine(34) synthetase TilS [Streptococcus panodentis]